MMQKKIKCRRAVKQNLNMKYAFNGLKIFCEQYRQAEIQKAKVIHESGKDNIINEE